MGSAVKGCSAPGDITKFEAGSVIEDLQIRRALPPATDRQQIFTRSLAAEKVFGAFQAGIAR